MDSQKLQSRLLCRWSRPYRNEVLRLVTPFTPFLLSDFHLSREPRRWGVRILNPRARDVRRHARSIGENARVFVEARYLREFVEDYLPEIRHPFVLLTGGWYLPTVEAGPLTDQLLQSEKVRLWFSHNTPVDPDLCRPFPYGMQHLKVLDVAKRMNAPPSTRTGEIFFGYVKVHDHLDDVARRARQSLEDRMSPPLPFPQYLDRIRTHRFIASPRGDRQDTYRHWEAIALGCVPIADLDRRPFERLFGRNMIFVDPMERILDLEKNLPEYLQPDATLTHNSHWAAEIEAALKASQS